MNTRLMMTGVLGLAAVALLGAQTTTKQDTKPTTKPATPPKETAPQPGQDDLMMKNMTPGEAHKKLEPLIGTWDAKASFWMAGPESQPEVSTGTAVSKWILDGRWIQTDYSSTWMDQPFHGIAFTGYDNAEKKYVNTWMDSMGTGMMYAMGTPDASGKVITFTTAQHTCAMTGKPVTFRNVWTVTSNDKNTLVMYHTYQGEKETKAGEIVYTRKR